MPNVHLTIDVEDWYDGMSVLGYPIAKPSPSPSGLDELGDLLRLKPDATVTLFVVAAYASIVKTELANLIESGHEIACHGADHGYLPSNKKQLRDWLRRGKHELEDLFQVPVSGFRPPRFQLPLGLDQNEFRSILAEAGFTYVSDLCTIGSSSPIFELPIFSHLGLTLGRGGWNRFVPRILLQQAIHRQPQPAIIYFHSYDFDRTLNVRMLPKSLLLVRQQIGRSRLPLAFQALLAEFGSTTCRNLCA